jgi:hypothetical protein
MKIYLAAPFEWIDRMKSHAAQLTALGHEITSRWLEEQDHGGETDLTDVGGGTKLDRRSLAVSYGIRDLRNIMECDVLVEFNPGKPFIRNTRIAELGVALALGKQVVVIGPEAPFKTRIDNIFVLLEEGTLPPDLIAKGIRPVKHFDTWSEFLVALLGKGAGYGNNNSSREKRLKDEIHAPIRN